MSKEKRKQELIAVPLPIDVFDYDGATIDRVKRVSVRRANDLRDMSRLDNDHFFEELAAIYPTWQGVLDCDYLEPIESQPKDDPQVFKLLDVSQLNWLIIHGLAYRPKAIGLA